MPRGYFLVNSKSLTLQPMRFTARKSRDIISAHGGRILVRGGDPQPLDGPMPQRRFVIVEFDSPEAAKAFYYSDAYQPVLPLRLNASSSYGFGCLLSGVE
jgi:uncharacterized protein (DUF1330 family)